MPYLHTMDEATRDCLYSLVCGKPWAREPKKPIVISSLRSLWNLMSQRLSNDDIDAIRVTLSPLDGKSDDDSLSATQGKEEVTPSQQRGANDIPDASQGTTIGSQQDPTVCPTHRRGICSDMNCQLEHPRICPKAQQFGIKPFNKRGCQKDSCPLFHPLFCRSSMTKGHCYRVKCNKVHLLSTN